MGIALKIRPLEASDLERRASQPIGSTPPPIKRIRHTHHKLARLLAEGINQTEAGLIAGFSPSRVSILLRDPSFAALVTHYKEQVEGAFEDFLEKLKDLSVDAVDEIRERLEDDPESINMDQLLKIAAFGADRSGFGSKSSVEHTLSSEAVARIEALKRAVEEKKRGQIIEARADAEDVGDAEGAEGDSSRIVEAAADSDADRRHYGAPGEAEDRGAHLGRPLLEAAAGPGTPGEGDAGEG